MFDVRCWMFESDTKLFNNNSGGLAMESGYRRLEIFTHSHDLAIEVHKMSLTLPGFELYEEGSQIRRSAKSIGANIVEGYCLRRHKNEYLQYLHRALGSSQETLYHLNILFETSSLKDVNVYKKLSEGYDHLGRMIFRFIDRVNAGHLPPLYCDAQESAK